MTHEEIIQSHTGDQTDWCDESGRLKLTKQSILLLNAFGALYWSHDDMATYFGISDLKWWQAETGNPRSAISREIARGKLEKRAKIELQILTQADAGRLDGIQEYKELVRDRSFTLSRLDVFGGSDNADAWNRIQEYIASGSKGRLSQKEERYLDLLVLIYSLDGQHGKRNTIRFLTSPPFEFSYEQAARLYAESIEMFYCNRQVSRQALQAKTADQFENLYLAAMRAAKTTKDYEAAANILAQKAKLLRLDQPEAQRLPAELFRRQFTVVTSDPKAIGLPDADRVLLGRQIDQLDAPNAYKERILEDAAIKDFDIVKRMEDESQETS